MFRLFRTILGLNLGGVYTYYNAIAIYTLTEVSYFD